jgi:hypothetical protein
MANENRIHGFGYLFLSLGFGYQAAKAFGIVKSDSLPGIFNGSPQLAGRGGGGARGLAGPESDAMNKAGGVIEKATNRTVANIQERVDYIGERIRKDSLKPIIREKALAVLTRKCETTSGGKRWCITPKDYESEVRALYAAVQDANSDTALRYVRDHVVVDQFTAADKLIKLKGGDCDDGTILLGAMLRSVGYPTKMRVIQDSNSSTWSHIYLLVGLPPTNPNKWVPLDWSMYPFKAPGWEAPGAAQVALSGRPSGMVTKLRDFEV